MWPGSTSTANLTRTGQATLMLVHEGVGYYLRLSAQRLADLTIGRAPRAFFRATIEEVLEDVVAYATITSGLTFRLVDRSKVLPGWEETVRALRATSIPD
jgi:hypothetical protein